MPLPSPRPMYPSPALAISLLWSLPAPHADADNTAAHRKSWAKGIRVHSNLRRILSTIEIRAGASPSSAFLPLLFRTLPRPLAFSSISLSPSFCAHFFLEPIFKPGLNANSARLVAASVPDAVPNSAFSIFLIFSFASGKLFVSPLSLKLIRYHCSRRPR